MPFEARMAARSCRKRKQRESKYSSAASGAGLAVRPARKALTKSTTAAEVAAKRGKSVEDLFA